MMSYSRGQVFTHEGNGARGAGQLLSSLLQLDHVLR